MGGFEGMTIFEKHLIFVIMIIVFSFGGLMAAYHMSSDAFPLTNGFEYQCYETGYFKGMDVPDPLCDTTKGFDFFYLSMVSVVFIGLASFVGSFLRFSRKKNFYASLLACLVWVIIINIVAFSFKIPNVFIAPY